MEKELNIAAILKDKPAGTKLWSPIFGDCKFSRLSSESGIRVFPIHNGFTSTEEKSFFKTGQYTLAGEVCLFPSKQMQDWSKFAWKKGDVLTDEKRYVIFRSFENDDYIEFFAPFEYVDDNTFRRDLGLITNEFRKVNDYVAQEIIGKVEEHYGGKLNLETSEIEKQPEFKDGDIAFADFGNTQNVFIISGKTDLSEGYDSFISLDLNDLILNIGYRTSFFKKDLCKLRLATDSEKQQLFDALAKEGKRWNPDTKQIEDLPKKCELKPFDKVLVKIAGHTWTADFFSHYDENDEELPYICIGYGRVTHCIHYNEETKHLLGTTDEWKGGE